MDIFRDRLGRYSRWMATPNEVPLNHSCVSVVARDQSQDLRDVPLDCLHWRMLVNDAALRCGPVREAVCPFGFEVTGDRSFLSKDLRRFYVYVGVSEAAVEPHHFIAEQYAEKLMESMEIRYPRLFNHIDVVVTPRRTIHLHSREPKRAIYIFVRPTHAGLIHEWAAYVLISAEMILGNRLPELRQFNADRLDRAYIFQLSVILHHIVDSGRHRTEEDYRAIRRLASPNSRHSLLVKATPATREEKRALANIVMPQMQSIADALRTQDDDSHGVRLVVRDFHSDEVFKATFHRKGFELLVGRLVAAYQDYCP